MTNDQLWMLRDEAIEQAEKAISSPEATQVLQRILTRTAEFAVVDGEYLFYSGADEATTYNLRNGVQPMELDFAPKNGVRIDDTQGGQWLREAAEKLPKAEKDALWAIASAKYAEQAEGKVVAVSFDVANTTWSKIELPTLLLNEHVEEINGTPREKLLDHALKFGMNQVQYVIDDRKLSMKVVQVEGERQIKHSQPQIITAEEISHAKRQAMEPPTPPLPPSHGHGHDM